MSAESERIDLNSDVVLSEPDNEAAAAEANRLNGQGKSSMAGSSVEVKEENKVRVLEGESKKEDLESEGLDKVVNGGELEDLSSKVLESEECNEKDVTLSVNEDPLRSLEGERDMENRKGEVDLLGKDKEEGVSFDVEKEKAIGEVERVASLDRGVSSAVNVSSKVGDSSHSESLEAVEPKTMGSAESVRELKDYPPSAEVEEKVDLDDSLDPGDSKVSVECGPAPSDGLQNGVLEVHLESETKETGVPRSSGNETDSFNIVIDLNSKSSSKHELGVGDLVWGKVRSHPWWPGQVCDPKAASRKAKKYSKRDAYLIAYFGDNTFAWNEASMVKPFLENFAQMEKHSNNQDFHQAIACALEEVSRRVEFGLACSCLSEEVFAKIKSQIIVNAGIQEELSRRDGGDSSLTVACFEPSKLVGYIKELAQVPYDVTHDRLELALARSWLLAFYRFKGYTQLPEFDMLGGILENDADFLLSTEKKHCDEARVAVDRKHKDDGGLVSQKKGKSMIQDCSSRKRKLTSGNITCSRKKEKSLSDLMAEKRMKTSTSENSSGGKAASKKREAGDATSDDTSEKHMKTSIGENGSGGKATSKKRKAGDATSDGTPVKETKSMAMEVDNKPLLSKQTFRVGDSIRRVASQLNGSSPILKNGSGSLTQTKSKEKAISEESKAGKSLEREHSPDEMLSQLCLAAKDPMGVNNSSVVTFFSEFRDTVSLDLPTLEEYDESLANLFGGNTGKELTKNGRKSNMSGMNELPNQLGSVNESYWSERIVRSIPEDQNETGEIRLETSKEEIPQTALGLDSEQKTYGENFETEAEKLGTDPSTGSSKEDLSPTALILNFTDFDSVPSETNLNKIFSSYGPLNELETEVFNKSSRAKVVFKRRSDAETAFSSAGKYSTFGRSLLSYRLKYSSSRPGKASPNSKKKRSKTDKASAEDNAK